MRNEKILIKLLTGKSDKNFSFNDLRKLLLNFGFNERIKGDHHIFTKESIEDIINIQPKERSKSKPYQVKQVREIITKYKLHEDGA